MTLETVGASFQGHTNLITGLGLSFDQTLLASASIDNTIKLWAFESRQLLASFDVQNIFGLVLSPNLRQLAYTIYTKDDNNICICDIPQKVLAQARNIARTKSNLDRLLHTTNIRHIYAAETSTYK
ncbi:hypothetical protein P692DRAFT_201315859 [Suillus brevipes Sb2]|nr:hypothetical protein P692DRAFT_201315859 [Suillus brevipes Sb2]